MIVVSRVRRVAVMLAALAGTMSTLVFATGEPAPASTVQTAAPQAPAPPVAPVPAPKGTDTLLPGGATSLQETYGDWLVRCVPREPRKLCSLSQQLQDKEGRRVAAVELVPASTGGAAGVLLLPFGLAVDREITLEAASRPVSTLRFRTCLQAGCVADVKFDTAALAQLGKEEALAVKTTADGGQPFAFNLSLKGFQSAFDRTAALLK